MMHYETYFSYKVSLILQVLADALADMEKAGLPENTVLLILHEQKALIRIILKIKQSLIVIIIDYDGDCPALCSSCESP